MTAKEPRYRIVFGVDVEHSTTRNNNAKAHMRDAMYRVVTDAFARNGVAATDHDPFLDRGDGLVALLQSSDRVPKTLLLRSIVPDLSLLVDEHNEHHPKDRVRLRAVLHAGEVHYDTRGPFGETLDVAFRLLNSPVTKRALRRTIAPVVLAVSEELHRSIVRHHYDGIDPATFSEFPVRVDPVTWGKGWLHVPGAAERALVGSDRDGHSSAAP